VKVLIGTDPAEAELLRERARSLAFTVVPPPRAPAERTVIAVTASKRAGASLVEFVQRCDPGARIVLPEPQRPHYEGRRTLDLRWYISAVEDPDYIDPPSFGDVLWMLEGLVGGAAAQWGERPLLVGHSQGANLVLGLALTMPDQIGGVVAVDGFVPLVPGLELHDGALGLNVLLVDGARATGERDAARLVGKGAVAEWVSAVDAADLGMCSRELAAGWWARQVSRPTINVTDRS
jgi:predicted esterase